MEERGYPSNTPDAVFPTSARLFNQTWATLHIVPQETPATTAVASIHSNLEQRLARQGAIPSQGPSYADTVSAPTSAASRRPLTDPSPRRWTASRRYNLKHSFNVNYTYDSRSRSGVTGKLIGGWQMTHRQEPVRIPCGVSTAAVPGDGLAIADLSSPLITDLCLARANNPPAQQHWLPHRCSGTPVAPPLSWSTIRGVFTNSPFGVYGTAAAHAIGPKYNSVYFSLLKDHGAIHRRSESAVPSDSNILNTRQTSQSSAGVLIPEGTG